MAQQFSNEIYSMIIDNLEAEVSTLRRVSLVNKAFATSSRLYLWRRVILTPRDPTSNRISSCARFHEILTGVVMPDVADLVQELCIADNTEFPSTLSTDVHLPVVLNNLTGLTKLHIFNMFWPTDNNHPLITSIRNILRSTILEDVTIVSSVIPTYLINDCLAVRTLRLRGSEFLSMAPGAQAATPPPQPQQMILDVDPSVAVDIWPRVNTSHLQSLVIQLPVLGTNMSTTFQQHNHVLQYLGLNYMENAEEYPLPNFSSLARLRELFIAFPTWIPAWPGGLATLLEFLDPLMQNLEQVHLYLILEPADTLVNEDEQDLHQPQDFLVLDRRLSRLQSPRLVNIHIALCPNSDLATDVRGWERIKAELPATHARNILCVDVVAELPWDSMFRN